MQFNILIDNFRTCRKDLQDAAKNCQNYEDLQCSECRGENYVNILYICRQCDNNDIDDDC